MNGGKGNCRAEGEVYRGEYLTCREKGPTSTITKDGNMKTIDRVPGTKSVYIGETSRSAFTRGRQHMNALKNPKRHTENAFCKHIIECHKGDRSKVKFKVDVISQFKKPMERQICEGVEIFRAKCDILMNSKIDHYQPAVGRVTVTNNPRM